MDKKKLRPSKNFTDKTGYTESQRQLDSFLTLLNPVYAIRNIRGSLIENGIIEPKEKRIVPLADFNDVPQSDNFVDKTGVTSEMRARLDNYFRNLLFDRESQASFKDPMEHAFRHKYKAPPLTKQEMIDIIHGPYSLGPGVQQNSEPAMDSLYRKIMDDHLRKKWRKSDGGYEVTIGK